MVENRVVILSHGDSNIGTTPFDAMLYQNKRCADKGITSSTIGFGQRNHRDTSMKQLANNRDGNNSCVVTRTEAEQNVRRKLGPPCSHWLGRSKFRSSAANGKSRHIG